MHNVIKIDINYLNYIIIFKNKFKFYSFVKISIYINIRNLIIIDIFIIDIYNYFKFRYFITIKLSKSEEE